MLCGNLLLVFFYFVCHFVLWWEGLHTTDPRWCKRSRDRKPLSTILIPAAYSRRFVVLYWLTKGNNPRLIVGHFHSCSWLCARVYLRRIAISRSSKHGPNERLFLFLLWTFCSSWCSRTQQLPWWGWHFFSVCCEVVCRDWYRWSRFWGLGSHVLLCICKFPIPFGRLQACKGHFPLGRVGEKLSLLLVCFAILRLRFQFPQSYSLHSYETCPRKCALDLPDNSVVSLIVLAKPRKSSSVFFPWCGGYFFSNLNYPNLQNYILKLKCCQLWFGFQVSNVTVIRWIFQKVCVSCANRSQCSLVPKLFEIQFLRRRDHVTSPIIVIQKMHSKSFKSTS